MKRKKTIVEEDDIAWLGIDIQCPTLDERKGTETNEELLERLYGVKSADTQTLVYDFLP